MNHCKALYVNPIPQINLKFFLFQDDILNLKLKAPNYK